MKVEFWFEFASTYSYLSVMRLPQEAAKRGVGIVWRPFLLGPIFAAQGLTDSPFNTYPVKGRYMWRDMERRAAALGIPFSRPAIFPQNGLRAARIATAAFQNDDGVAFCQNVFKAHFGQGQDISDPDTLASIAMASGLPDTVLKAAQSAPIKANLRQTTEEAQSRNIFGSPSFTVGNELFWGDDRLEDALDWATRHG